jgi:hypothetical protein
MVGPGFAAAALAPFYALLIGVVIAIGFAFGYGIGWLIWG